MFYLFGAILMETQGSNGKVFNEFFLTPVAFHKMGIYKFLFYLKQELWRKKRYQIVAIHVQNIAQIHPSSLRKTKIGTIQPFKIKMTQ